MNPHYYGVILAGGRGTRFWPKSRKRSSKQVLNVVGRRTLIQSAVERLAPLIPPERVWVLTNGDLRDTVIAQLPEVPPGQILAEPAQRNTAPAIGLAAQILQSIDKDAVMGVFPADHVISKPPGYRAAVKAALKGAVAGKLMVIGVPPRWPETGYGYVEFPEGTESGFLRPVAVRRFREKPPAAAARRYLAAGNFYWNAGMFFWRADVLLGELRRQAPRTATILAALPEFADRSFASQVKRSFPLCENISIDYAVLEKAEEVWGIAAADFGWNDVGSWNAVYELLAHDARGNAAPPHTLCLDSDDNLVDAGGKMVALLGVKNTIVVDTPDALLVVGRDQAHRVGEVVKALEKLKREDLL